MSDEVIWRQLQICVNDYVRLKNRMHTISHDFSLYVVRLKQKHAKSLEIRFSWRSVNDVTNHACDVIFVWQADYPISLPYGACGRARAASMPCYFSSNVASHCVHTYSRVTAQSLKLSAAQRVNISTNHNWPMSRAGQRPAWRRHRWRSVQSWIPQLDIRKRT